MTYLNTCDEHGGTTSNKLGTPLASPRPFHLWNEEHNYKMLKAFVKKSNILLKELSIVGMAYMPAHDI
jgi:hypothetical protein